MSLGIDVYSILIFLWREYYNIINTRAKFHSKIWRLHKRGPKLVMKNFWGIKSWRIF